MSEAMNVKRLRQALGVYLAIAYPGGTPAGVQERLKGFAGLAEEAPVPWEGFESSEVNGRQVHALRLGQPIYPYMKLVIEEGPGGAGWLFRADAHDSHLHAPPGSKDAEWLGMVRAKNKELTEAIEAAWTKEGLMTFRELLRQQLEKRKSGR